MSRVAIRYSKALFGLALEQNALQDTRTDLGLINDVCIANPDFQNTLVNPLIEERVKARLLESLFKDQLKPLTYKFLQLLSRKKRSGFLLEIIDDFQARLLDHEGILSGTLISASPLETSQVEEIRNRIETMTEKKVIFSEQVDKSVVGGFIVQIKDTVIDLSLKTQFDKLRSVLVHG